MRELTAHELEKYVGKDLHIIRGDAKEAYPLQHDAKGFFLMIEPKWSQEGARKDYVDSQSRYDLTPDALKGIFMNMSGKLSSKIELPLNPETE